MTSRRVTQMSRYHLSPKKSARLTGGINEVLTVGSPPALTRMGVLFFFRRSHKW